MRGEYSDNYFFTADNPQSAFTASITPFLTAARKTEASNVAAVLAIGGNRVWGPSPTSDYASGRAGVDGTWRDDRSTWAASLAFVRSPILQNTVVSSSTVLGLAYTNAASATGSYTYALGERWSTGATGSVYSNRYSGVSSDGTFSDNHGYYAGGTLGYAFSERTQATLAAGYSYYSSDISHSDSVTGTLGVVHQLSPQLTVSLSGGGFWSDTTLAQGALDVSTTDRRATGTLWGGQIAYTPSEQLQFSVSLSEGLAPSGTGVVSKSDNAGASLTYRFADRLTGRVGVGYTRTIYPQASSSAYNSSYWEGGVGISYQLAERWSLEGGYRYVRAQYSQNQPDARSNSAFLSIAYNWPGASFTDWVGKPSDTQSLPAAGPGALPTQPGSSTPERSPFEPFTIP